MYDPMTFLHRFCEPDPHNRFDLTKPFTLGNWTYATDGKVCVRLPALFPESESEPAEGKRFVNAQSLPWDHEKIDGEWLPVPPCPVKLEYEYDVDFSLVPAITRMRIFVDSTGKELHVDAHHLAKFAGVSSLEMRIQPRSNEKAFWSAVLLRFDGGQALLMPCGPVENVGE